MKLKKTNIYFSTKTMEAFKEIANSKGIPVSELIRRALDEWLETYNKK